MMLIPVERRKEKLFCPKIILYHFLLIFDNRRKGIITKCKMQNAKCKFKIQKVGSGCKTQWIWMRAE